MMGKGFHVKPSVVAELTARIHAFLSANPDKVCVVHCTHGYNRTGLIVCAYLHQYENMSLNDAVALFKARREYVLAWKSNSCLGHLSS